VTILTRWIGFAALAALIGGLVMEVAVLPADAVTLERRLVSWSRTSVALLLLAGVGELLLRAQTMAGASGASAFAVAPSVLARTHFGTVWTVRAIVLLALLGLTARNSPAARWAAFVLALAIALTTTLVGHAADQGDLSLGALVDWLHVTAAGAWTGGLFCLATLVPAGTCGWPQQRLAALLGRFSRIAGWCLLVVVSSGLYNACIRLGSLHTLWTTTYGTVLVAKAMLVLVMASLGAVNRFAVLPELSVAPTQLSGSARAPAARLATYVAWEAALALLVLGCTALLTESTPPRHLHAAHPSSAVRDDRYVLPGLPSHPLPAKIAS
jgi:putative copper export protein